MGSLVKDYSKEKLTGQIFTPFFIVDKILDDIGYNSPAILQKTIIDPACGDGRFLLKIVERIIKFSSPEELAYNLSYVYGWDIDADAIGLAKQKLDELIARLDIQIEWNIKVENSLHYDAQQQFDFVVGNPPYIRIQHLEEEERKYIQKHYPFCSSGSTDIYIAFYELALRLLNSNGKCGFITPNTFFQTQTAADLRLYFEEQQNLLQISNYGALQLFDDATTYSAICIFDKKKHSSFLYQAADTKQDFKERRIDFKEINNTKFWQLSVNIAKNVKGNRLGDIANIHVGITTLADKTYIMPMVEDLGDFVVLQSKNNGAIKIERGILRPIVKVSTLKSAEEPIKEYVIFPYQNGDDKPSIIEEEKLKRDYPLAYQYLLSVRDILDKRDNGKPNKVTWYAYGRSQGLTTSFGPKILFSPMNKAPKFIYHANTEATFYSGYCIKYSGNHQKLLAQLNSPRMEEYIRVSARDFRGGWKAYNKKIVQEFIIFDE
jgi:methylase of polypeptide subunit release factors